MQPTIFISREERRAKSFVDIVKNAVSRITCKSLIDFSIVNSTGLPDHGWLFFYSQTGVDFFLKQHNSDEIRFRNLKIAAFGPKTGLYITKQGLPIDFTGTGEAKSTANDFMVKKKPSSICFIKGSISKNSLRPLVKDEAEVSSLVVYDNSGKKSINLPTIDILVFTSPLNLETYFSHYSKVPNQKVVVIGTSTAMSALDCGVEEVHISPLPSLESLATLVLGLCATWSSTK